VNVKAIDRNLTLLFQSGEQGGASFYRDREENGVGRVGRFIRKVNASLGVQQHPTGEQVQVDERGIPVPPTRFDGVELVGPAMFVLRSAKAAKVRVYLALAGISRVRVNTVRICLPYFEEGILNWGSVPIVHNACQADAFAGRAFVRKDVLFFAVDQPYA
jgi:hypothetical protein